MLSSRSFTRLGSISAIVAAAALVAACDRQSVPPTQPQASASASAPAATEPAGTIDRSHKGEALPAFTVRNPAGEPLDLASLKGKPVLINLWATWCAPCVVELPTLDALAARGTVRVLTVSQDMKTGPVPAFLKAKGGPHLPAWLDPESELSFRYKAPTLPTTILYGADGKEVWRWVGGNDWSNAAAAKLVAEAS